MAIMTDKWVILRNNQALRSRDNAGTGLVSILKVDTSDEIELLTTVNYTDATHGKDELANTSILYLMPINTFENTSMAHFHTVLGF